MDTYGDKKQMFSLGSLFRCCLLVISLTTLLVAQSWGVDSNVMTSLDFTTSAEMSTVKIVTESPVGYRYTVYDSIDPIRIIVDFPGMDVDSVLSLTDLDDSLVESVDVSSFDLTSGKLGRVEIVLTKLIEYDVAIEGADFKLSFASDTVTADTTDPTVAVSEATNEDVAETEAIAVDPVLSDNAATTESVASADSITGVDIHGSSVTLQANGPVEIFKYFTLGAPARLVLDVYGLKAGFKQRVFDLDGDFNKIRVGPYDDKIRFVFDADGTIPDFSVDTAANSVLVAWGSDAGASAPTNIADSGAAVNVEAVDFKIEDGVSVLRVTLNDSSAVIQPTQKGDIVGFGVKNATISRALRRAVDASSFPSSIRLVTPYTVLVGDQQDVRFAVELKGPSEYELVEEGNSLLFKVVNGPFAEPDPMTTQVEVEVPDIVSDQVETVVDSAPAPIADADLVADSDTDTQMVTESFVPAVVQDDVQILGGAETKAYSGQRISLVFDNAEIRNILQLIAEVSNLNILAGDGVDGTITLRLIDVPWDQALDLILDTKDLGIIRDGNVAKILPKESIRSMDEAKFSAKRTQEKLEDLSTDVIKISYTDLKNVTTPVKALLSTRGSVTEDSRNKQLIVTDIKSNIEKIRALATILDTPERQVLIEARIVEVNKNAALDLGVNWNVLYNQDPAGGGNTGSALSLGGLFAVNPSFASPGVGSVFQWGQIGVNTAVLDLRLSALEAKGDGRVVSNPRIMALNGETAKITQGTLIPYQTVSDGEISTEFIEAALALEVTAVINPDDTVILQVKASNSAPGATSGQIDKKEAETKMLVTDGTTMVIGGVYVERDSTSNTGVPLLMDIPLLGSLFKSTKIIKNRSEMMIFITPRILQ